MDLPRLMERLRQLPRKELLAFKGGESLEIHVNHPRITGLMELKVRWSPNGPMDSEEVVPAQPQPQRFPFIGKVRKKFDK